MGFSEKVGTYFSRILYRIPYWKVVYLTKDFSMFFRNAALEIINRKSYTKSVKNKFPLFQKTPSTLKSSLEKTTDRI